MGFLRLWLPDSPVRVPYLRSLTQVGLVVFPPSEVDLSFDTKSTFYDGFSILHRHSLDWMVQQFFCETIGVDYNSIHKAIIETWTGSEPAPLKRLDRSLYKVYITVCFSLPAVLLTAIVNTSSYQSPLAQPTTEKTTFYEISSGMA